MATNPVRLMPLPEELAGAIAEYLESKREAEEATANFESAKAQLKMVLGEIEELPIEYEGQKYNIHYKSEVREDLDQPKFRAAYPELWQRFKRLISSRPLRVIAVKMKQG